MRCKDCGTKEYEPSTRGDVCKPCMENRLRLIRGVESGKVSLEEFHSVQRAMATDVFRHGRASKKIIKILNKDRQ